jgi:hypothetical protein
MVGENEPWLRDGWVCESRDNPCQPDAPALVMPLCWLGEN